MSIENLVNKFNSWCFEENNLTPSCKEKERQQIAEDTEHYLRNNRNTIQLLPAFSPTPLE